MCRAPQVEGLFLGAGSWELLSRVGQVDVPLLTLLADPAYTIIAQEAREELERWLPPAHATLVTIPGTTHNMHRGAGFVSTIGALLGWLKR
jgi:pimeloyl-ACP methyl ester carboxylesterase